jgi:hypothetical protein
MISAMKKLALATALLALPHACPVLAQESAGPALWKVADEDTTIYLFGTVHILPKDVDWLKGEVKAAFDAAPEFVTEADMTKMEAFAPRMAAAGTLPEGQTLRSLMSDENRAEYEAALAALQVPAANVDRFEPWLAARALRFVILLKNGYDPNSGVDIVLTQMASDKQRDALETLEFQLEMVDTTPMDQQLSYLDDVVGWVPVIREWNDRMVALWLAGDAAALADHIAMAYTDPHYYDRILTDRNASWAEWIDQRLDQPGTVFVAVGAGHLAGRGSVQEQLAKRGIETDRLQ